MRNVLMAFLSEDPVGEAAAVTVDVLALLLGMLLGILVAIVIGVILLGIGRMITNRHPSFKLVAHAVYKPAQMLLIVIGAWIGFSAVSAKAGVTVEANAAGLSVLDFTNHAFVILCILAATWLAVGVVNGVTNSVHEHIRESSERRAKKVQTQLQILHRVIIVVVWIMGFAGVLLTFPGARAAGASLIASAGVVSVVAGLAAQTTLGNVFAGLQLAFSDSIRVGDIVYYQNAYTTVEEITLTYVVLAVWDGRRIIVPSSLMTTQSFENWTRRAPEMVGTVEIDVDWAVPIKAAREQLMHILRSTELWDGRTGVLQVWDATLGKVQLRIVISAKNSPALSDLKNHVREKMVTWIQHEAPQAIPHNHNWEYVPLDLVQAEEATTEATRARIAAAEAMPAQYPPALEVSGSGETAATKESQEVEEVRDGAGADGVALPEARVELFEEPTPSAVTTRVLSKEDIQSAIFSGSADAERRSREFAGPDEEVYEERARQLERSTGDLKKVRPE